MKKTLSSELKRFGIMEDEMSSFKKRKFLSFGEVYESEEPKLEITKNKDKQIVKESVEIGPQGARGYQGPQGAVGPQGISGTNGIQGPAGVKGDIGFQGAQGSIGPQGPVGRDGRDGLQGAPGRDGDTGPQGIGLQGPQGDTGKDGAAGETGPQGLPGEIGPQGAVGEQGIPGEPGMPGLPGMNGLDGMHGMPAPIYNNMDMVFVISDSKLKEFTLATTYVPNSEYVFINGEMIYPVIDYVINNNVITLNEEWKLKEKNKVRVKFFFIG
jgi:hypothetical protein